jgi:hypothetical protein
VSEKKMSAHAVSIRHNRFASWNGALTGLTIFRHAYFIGIADA